MLFLSLKTQDSRRWHWHRIVRYFRRRVVSYWHPGPTALRTLASLSLGIMMLVYRGKSFAYQDVFEDTYVCALR